MKSDRRVVINNPYQGIDWQQAGQYKANLHAHTLLHKVSSRQTVYATESDFAQFQGETRGTWSWKGSRVEELYDCYRDLGYRVLAFTDHSYLADSPHSSYGRGSLKAIRDLKAYGAKTDDSSVLLIPGKEISHIVDHLGQSRMADHVLALFFSDGDSAGQDLAGNISLIEQSGGLAVLAHPAVYDRPPGYFQDLLTRYPATLLEAYNPQNGAERNFQVWDSLLSALAPGQNVLAVSGDDSYYPADAGRTYLTLLMPELSAKAVKRCLNKGQLFFAVPATPTKGCVKKDGPVIDQIIVDRKITIRGRGIKEINWLTAQGLIAGGEQLDLANSSLHNYVRAEIVGCNLTRLYTQAFLLS